MLIFLLQEQRRKHLSSNYSVGAWPSNQTAALGLCSRLRWQAIFLHRERRRNQIFDKVVHSKNCVVVFSEVNLNQLRSWSIWLLSGRINNWTSGSFWLGCKCYAMTCTIQPRKRVVFAAGMRIDIRGFTNNIILNCLYFFLSDKLFTPLDLEY